MTIQYLIPVPKDLQGNISQRFGENPQNYPKTKGHTGIDWAIQEGTAISSGAYGTVSRAELDTETASNPKYGYGYHIRIKHSDGSTSIYGHLQQGGILLKTGQIVQMGEVIGHSGNTGYSTGPHLHFEVRSGEAISTAFDPEPWLINDIPESSGIMIGDIADGISVNLRTAPNVGSSKQGALTAGTEFQVVAITGTDAWLQVIVKSGALAGKGGFVYYQTDWEHLKVNDA